MSIDNQPVQVLDSEETEGDEKPWWFGLPQRPATPLKWVGGNWYEDSDGWKIELGVPHPPKDEIIGPPYPEWWNTEPKTLVGGWSHNDDLPYDRDIEELPF